MRPRIAICGTQGSGKTTVADALRAHYGLTPLSMAAPIKVIGKLLAERFPQLDADPNDKVSMRPLYQAIGEGGRAYDSDIWLHAMLDGSGLLNASTDTGYVLDDVRFKNEGDLLRAYDFLVIRMECDEETRKNRLASRDGHYDVASFSDISETSVAEVPHDILLANGKDRTLDSLITEAIAVVEHHFILTPADRADLEGA
jgi:dephospho-CoA kinase